MLRLEKKHPRAIRWMHWVNFPVLTVMIASGVLIYWADDVYRVGLGGWTLFHFSERPEDVAAGSWAAWTYLPAGTYTKLHVNNRLALGMAWHFAFAWLFAVNGVLYVAYTFASGEWRYLLPNRATFREAWDVVVHDTREVLYQGYGVAAVLATVFASRGRLLFDRAGLRRAWHHAVHESFPPIEPLPRRKFNGAQRLAYTGVICMGAGSLATGLAIYKPVQLAWLTTLLGGYEWARWEHFWLTVGYVAFFLTHIAQVARAGWNNFRSMATGYELARAEEPTYESSR